VLFFPMLAAWIVAAFVSGPSSRPDARNAKSPGHGGTKTSEARPSSRGRILPPGAAESIERSAELPGAPVGARQGLPTRDSAYVCPNDMVPVGRFCVDVYEASLVQVMPDGSEQPWPYYAYLTHGVNVRAVSASGVFPQGYISGDQARAACQASGKRLCSPTEWRTACRGPDNTTFPYGNHRETGRCNDNGRSAMRFFNPQLDGTLTKTGERSGCTNGYGVFDMVGNLHEWVDDPAGTFQGGYYLDTHLNGDGCNYRTTAHPITHYDYSTGFRCCADVASM
jgi:hypothetical protein